MDISISSRLIKISF